jgi:putative transcriptional regulator
MASMNHKSRILSEMHETAKGLHASGLIDKRSMREFDILCDLGIAPMTAQKIKQLREEAHVSQAVFAAILNISVSTVQKWEIGDKRPGGASLKLLSLIERKGLEAVL